MAAGRSFCAAATSSRLLRLFAPSGEHVIAVLNGKTLIIIPSLTLAIPGTHMIARFNHEVEQERIQRASSHALLRSFLVRPLWPMLV